VRAASRSFVRETVNTLCTESSAASAADRYTKRERTKEKEGYMDRYRYIDRDVYLGLTLTARAASRSFVRDTVNTLCTDSSAAIAAASSTHSSASYIYIYIYTYI